MSDREQQLDQEWLRVKQVLLAPTPAGKGGGYDDRVQVKWHGRKTPSSVGCLWALLCGAADAAIIKTWENAA
jgi:hypothetical protein